MGDYMKWRKILYTPSYVNSMRFNRK